MCEWRIFFKSVNIWQSYKQERGCLTHFARLANTLLEDEESARDNHIWQNYGHEYVAPFFRPPCIYATFLPKWRYANSYGHMSDCLSVRLSVCLSVCLSQVGVLSKRMDESICFLAERIFWPIQH